MSATGRMPAPARAVANPGRVTVDLGEDLVAALVKARDRESRDTLANMVRVGLKEWLAGKYPDIAAELDRTLSATGGAP